MTNIKFSELTEIVTPDDNDVFALSDISSSESKKITYANLKTDVTDNFLSNNVDEIISFINAYDDGTGDNGLIAETANNATNLNSLSASYYLEYDNFTNTPTNLSDFTNDNKFVRFVTTPTNKLIYDSVVGVADVSTSFVKEGTNLYYTDQRVEDFFDANFAAYYALYSTSFEDGVIANSLSNVSGEFISTSGAGGNLQSATITITDTNLKVNFQVGQTIRVYGASNTLTNKLDSNASSFSSLVRSGFTDGTGGGQDTKDFHYKLAEFSYEYGETAPVSLKQTITVGIADPANVLESFNIDKFIQVNFTGVVSTRGILLYRAVTNVGLTPASDDYKLIAVLGPKDLASFSYIDYYDFDYNSWSGKNENSSYPSANLVHFRSGETSATSPSITSRRGWTDATILEVNDTQSGFNVVLESSVFIDIDKKCKISHNDTSRIQTAINAAQNAGLNTVALNPKEYIVEQLNIPDGFGLQGVNNITKLTKLPWSSSQNRPNMIRSSNSSNATDISLVGFDVDGNSLNQVLYEDSTDVSTNYLINFGTDSSDIIVDGVRINKPIGGGIYVSRTRETKLVNSDIKDSGLTDRYSYSPIVADFGNSVIANSNVMRNFSDYADFSIGNKNVVLGNVFDNVGSGLFVYGSKFSTYENNVLVGPANEFIQQPDTLNSEYDSVNINLQNAYLASGQYTSPVLTYQENGLDYDLTANTSAEVGGTDGTLGEITYDVIALQKSSLGVESIWVPTSPNNTDAVTLVPRSGLLPQDGQFGFNISSNDVTKLTTGVLSYPTLYAINNDHVGLAWTATFNHEVKAGDVNPTVSIISTTVYQAEIANPEYIGVGSEVKLKDHGGDVPSTIGIITSKSDNIDGTSTIQITYAGANITTAGSGGTINIIDRFVIAKGRIVS